MSSQNDAPDPRGNLPLPLNSFVGRRQEMAAVKRLLPEHRLLTLTGAGGCGKTRLATQVARDLQAAYRHGVWLLEFAALTEAALVPQLAASVLGVREQAGGPVEQTLAAALRTQHLLLLFDNCEHLASACAFLARNLLKNCPHVQILATSREPLGLPGEAVWIVPPLALPEQRPWRSPASEQESLAAYGQADAIQLFVDRAQTVSPQFRLTAENGPWVATICRRLDGMPLAIELAAAHLRVLSARQIAERLDDRFELLTSRLRTAPERHQTLEAALDWSYALLTDAEKRMFSRLSVFANGWTLEAAGTVCAPPEAEPLAALNILSRLVDKSLVVVKQTNGDYRYSLLETIRDYARQKLGQAGQAEVYRTKEQHLDFFARWAEAGAGHLQGPKQAAWLEKFGMEHDNVRAALEWSQHSGSKGQQGLRLAAAYGYFWRLRGYLSEGRARLAAVLEAGSAQARTRTRASALLWAANLAYLQSDYEATRALAEEALSVSTGLGPQGRAGVARALDLLGELATEVGDYEAAGPLLEDALHLYEEIGDARGSADMRMQLGWAAMREGEYDRARIWLEESLPLFRDGGESALVGIALAGLGELAVRQGRYKEADKLLEESIALRRELNDRWGIAGSLGTMGWVALLRRDFGRMRQLLRQSLEIRLDIGDQGGSAWCLEKLAEGAVLEGEMLPPEHRRRLRERAARVFGQAAAVREEVNSVIDPADKAPYERTLRKLRHALGKTAFHAAWEEGSSMPLPDLVREALAPALTQQDTARLSQAEVGRLRYGGLTPRERETAVLVAAGKSNREIAAAMTVRVKTVETYVSRILNKLGFDSRVQIATWAMQVGLAEHPADES